MRFQRWLVLIEQRDRQVACFLFSILIQLSRWINVIRALPGCDAVAGGSIRANLKVKEFPLGVLDRLKVETIKSIFDDQLAVELTFGYDIVCVIG